MARNNTSVVNTITTAGTTSATTGRTVLRLPELEHNGPHHVVTATTPRRVGPGARSLPAQLAHRTEGRTTGTALECQLLFRRAVTAGGGSDDTIGCTWQRSAATTIGCPPVSRGHGRLRHAAVSTTTAMDVVTGGSGNNNDDRFFVTGSYDGVVRIYDLWSNNNDDAATKRMQVHAPQTSLAQSQPQRHHVLPIQQASVGSTLHAVRWYPGDPAIFLTAHAGTVQLWDTNAMTPVLDAQPFRHSNYHSSSSGGPVVRCLEVSSFAPLAAVGSRGADPTVKLVDLRSGAAAHTLSPSSPTGSATKTTFSARGGSGGVTAVRWSPVCAHVLASCSAGTGLLWDVRQPRAPRAVLDAEFQPDNFPLLSTRYHLDGKHWRHSVPSAKSATAPFPTLTTTTTTMNNIQFDATGRQLVSVCGKSRAIVVWDLRSAPAPVRRWTTFCGPTGGPPLVGVGDDNNHNTVPPLLVTHHGGGSRNDMNTSDPIVVWTARGTELQGHSVRRGGRPIHSLRGHLGNVHVVATSSAVRPRRMYTAGTDGVVLVWEQPSRLLRTAPPPTPQNNRKRQRDMDAW